MSLTDIKYVAESRADDLREMGYESVEDVADADPTDLEELSRVGTNKAMEMVVSAENVASAEEEEDEEEEEYDEEDALEEFEVEDEASDDESDEEIEEESEEDSVVEEEGPTTYDVTLDLTPRQQQVFTAAMMSEYTNLRSRNRSRSQACLSILEKIEDGNYELELTKEELNAIHSSIRERRLDYQGNNHTDLMHETMEIEEQVTDARQRYLF